MDNNKLNIPLTEVRTPSLMRTEEEKAELLKRLRRIEGQVRGIQRMIDEDRYCVDILVQLSAITAALKKVGYHLLEDHTRGCVSNAVAQGEGQEVIEELMKVIQQFSKS